MKFSTKFTALFTAIVLIMGIIISYLVYSSNIKSFKKEIEGRLEDQAFHTMDKIDRMFFERHAEMKNLATDWVIRSRSSTPKEITERLTEFRDNHKIYTSLSFFDLNRLRIADTSGTDIGKQHPFTEYLQEIVEGKDFVLNISESEPIKETMINFAAIVKDTKGSAFAVVVSRISVQELFTITRHTAGIDEAEEGLEIELVDKGGLILYSNYNPKGILKEISPDWEDIKNDIATGKKVGSVKHIHLGEEEISTFAREQGHFDYKGNDWTLVICIPEKVAFASAIELRNKLVIIFLIVSFLAACIIYFFSRKVSEPIVKLRDASLEFVNGKLDEEVKAASKDEIGQLTEAFSKIKFRAEDAIRAKSDFLANMSHELRTPLNAIIGFSDMMFQGMAGKLTDQQHEYLGDIRESGEHLLALINDILDLSKVEAGKTELELSEFYIKDLIESCMILFKEKAMKQRIKFTAEVAPDVELIEADVRKIKQVIANLLSNAVKFTPDGGSVHVHARKVRRQESGVRSKKEISELRTQYSELDFDMIEITVEDTGIGIRHEDFDKLFQPFQQLEYALSKKYEGTGLGLTLCKRIVELHNGRIWVESEMGKGSKFIFVIPIRQ